MRILHDVKVDWLGKKWYLIGLSLVLMAMGLASLVIKGGPKYGIDFRGGTLVYVKFSQPANLDQIRAALRTQGLGDSTIQQYGPSSENEVIIGLDLAAAASSQALDAGKRAILATLTSLYGSGPADKVDFTNAGASVVAERLMARDPLRLFSKGTESATRTYRELAEAVVGFRNRPPQSGLVTSFAQLRGVPEVTPEVVSALEKDFYLASYALRNTEIVGPKVGADLWRQAVYVVLAGLAAMLVYIWFRFELIYGVAAVLAVFHDVIITLGFFSLLNKEISLTVIAALLTLVGYSMNDTIVIFDRIRENVRLNKRESFPGLINRSINQTLSRTILTSGLTFLAVLSLFLLGGEVIRGFSLAMVIGVIVGTYSSIAIASPILLFTHQRLPGTAPVVERPRVYTR